jgi:hypothetical protein
MIIGFVKVERNNAEKALVYSYSEIYSNPHVRI